MAAFQPQKYNAGALKAGLLSHAVFELMVVTTIVSGGYFTVGDSLLEYRKQYEVAELNWTLSALRTSRYTEEIVTRRLRGGVIDLHKSPMYLLSPVPRNYLGEYCRPDPAALAKGSWYFDKCKSQLVYIMHPEKFFATEHPKILKFNVESFRLLTDSDKRL